MDSNVRFYVCACVVHGSLSQITIPKNISLVAYVLLCPGKYSDIKLR